MHRLKIYISLILITILGMSLNAQTSSSPNFTKSDSAHTLTYDPQLYIRLADSVINFSKKYLGTPYRGGGKGPNSFDCSGFTSFVFHNFGIKLGSSSADQAENVPSICESEIQPGDLVFYNGRSRGHRVGHVGMVVSKEENGNFSFIHSASSVGISISSSTSDYYRRRFVKAGRVLLHDSLLARTFAAPIENLALNTTKTSSTVAGSPIADEAVQYETIIKKKHVPAKFHTVKSGETLSGIAAKHGISVATLKKQNNLKSDFLALKQRIKIAEAKKIEVEEKVALAKTTNENIQTVTAQTENSTLHTIKKGETLYSIAKLYGMKVSELEKINQLESGKIFPGQVIKLQNIDPTEKLASKETGTEELTHEQEKKTIAVSNIKKATKSKSHIVKKGESLSEIAERYNCTVREIKSWNVKKNNNINAGEKLLIKI